jgi:glycosyltransferase involved in cell wall biosynthesis
MTKSPSRILFVSYSADQNGPTNSLLLLLKYLRQRYDVAVLLPGRGFVSDVLTEEHIPFFTVKSLAKRSIPEIVRVILHERIDLVYGNNTSGSSRNAFIAAKITGRPFVCHVRAMAWEHSWRVLGFLRFADAVIAVSGECARSIARFVSPGRLYVAYNGVGLPNDGVEPSILQSRVQSETDRTNKKVIIVSVSHICPRKGQKYAIEAMTDIVKDEPFAHLLLVGSLERDPAYVKEIRKKVQQNHLESNVSILGFREDVWQLLQSADIYLHTAIQDPHPRSVLESMAAGLPAVAFAVDGVSETVVDGETGHLVPAGDVSGLAKAVLKLVRDEELRTKFGGNARNRAEHNFSAGATAQRVGDIIEQNLKPVKRAHRAKFLKFWP